MFAFELSKCLLFEVIKLIKNKTLFCNYLNLFCNKFDAIGSTKRLKINLNLKLKRKRKKEKKTVN